MATFIYGPWPAVRVASYVTAGGSLARLSRFVRSRASDPALVVGFNLGGGGSAALGTRLALRTDVRFVDLDDALNYWRTSAGLAVRLIGR